MKGKQAIWAVLAATAVSMGTPSVWAEPTAEQLRQTIRDYITRQEQQTGAFTIPDPREKGKLRMRCSPKTGQGHKVVM